MSAATGLSTWWPKDGLWWDREYVVELLEEFGSDGPVVIDWLSCQASLQNEGGWVMAGYKSCAKGCGVDAVTVRHVVSRAVQLEALDEFSGDERRFTCRISGWKADNDRVRAALRKREQRAREAAATDAAEPNQAEGQDVTDRDTSRSVTQRPQKSPQSRADKSIKATSPNPSASGGEPSDRPVPPKKPTTRRKRDLERYQAQLAAYDVEVDDWAPHAADLNGLAEPWERIDTLIRNACKEESTYQQWLAGVHPHRVAGSTLVLAVHPDIRSWVSRYYDRLLERATQAVLPGITSIDLINCAVIGHPGRPTTAEETR